MMLPFVLASALVAPSIVNAASSIGLPPSLPKYSKPLNKDFLGLSIEMDRWTSWAGDAVGKPNPFVNQVLSNLASLTGTAVPLRVGANSEDRGLLELNQQVANVTFPAPTPLVPYPEAEHIGIGRDFYALSQNLPDGTPFTWGINLRVNNRTETVGQAAQLYDTFYGSKKQNLSKVSLNTIEIGNEIDYYNNPQLRRSYPGYDIFAYTKQWADFGGQVADLFSKESHAPKFQIGAYVDYPNYVWTVPATLGTGVLDTKAGKNMDKFCAHNYQGVFLNNATADPKSGALMARANTRGSIARHAQAASQSNDAGLEYVLGESNSYANHGVPGISDSAEAAIWLLDFGLNAAANGIARMFMHEGVGFAYNLIQPVAIQGSNPTTRPKIQAPYYGAVMVNEAIGTGKNTQVVELPTNSSKVAAHGIWEGDRLMRVAVVNNQLYLPGMNRTTETIDIQGYAGDRKVSIKRFTPPSANATQGLTWGGVSYEAADGKPTGQVVEQWLNGTSFTMQATEAVLLCFK
ncbi:hypothetical protein QFC24_000933 [Naganishia onofrii]|uniref:Uncharacterized protein n=1 Tax=Naganishia onofrii TaxID=1851511 RepID=A0ACC2XU26_9TREE|nr:hypothetical protein QFC24_000933 [Naganishia onofrii]